MDSRQISIVKESFDKIKPNLSKVSRVFYDRLFELNPELRELFKSDMRVQRKKFVKILTLIVENLHDAKIVGAKIKELAWKHVEYSVKPEDYTTFGEALIFAISAALGDDSTKATKEAWKNSYQTLMEIMLKEIFVP